MLAALAFAVLLPLYVFARVTSIIEVEGAAMFALLLAAARRLAEGERDVRSGAWRTWVPDAWLGADVHGEDRFALATGRV